MAAPPEEKDSTISMVVENWNEDQTEQFSPVQRIGGYPWRLRLCKSRNKHDQNRRELSLICDKSSEAELWKCTATFTPPFYSTPISHVFTSWDERSKITDVCSSLKFAEGCNIHFDIATKEDGYSWTFCTTTRFNRSNGILLLGRDKRRLHVNRESMASQSPFLDRLFFGDFKEKNLNEVELRGVEYNEFVNIMSMIYRFSGATLTAQNVFRMIHLASRFEIKIMEDRIVSFLLSPSKEVSFAKKLLIADQYHLPFLMTHLLQRTRQGPQMEHLTKSPNFEQLSAETMRVLFKKMCNPHSQRESEARRKAAIISSIEQKDFVSIAMRVEKWGSDQTEQFSPVHHINGFYWRLRLYNDPRENEPDARSLSLICAISSEAELWQCNAVVLRPLTRQPDHKVPRHYLSFNSWDAASQTRVVSSPARIAVACTIKVKIAVKGQGKSWRVRPILSPRDPRVMRDGILVFGKEKEEIHLSKKSLASQSPVFDKAFNQFNGKLFMDDVGFEEFANILKLLYNFDGATLTDQNVAKVLELADRFEIKIVEDRVVSYLLSPASALSLQQKLLIADNGGIAFLVENLIRRRYGRAELNELCESPELEQLSTETLRMLFKKFCT